MSRAQDLTRDQQEATTAALREQLAETRGELRGYHRGEHRVAEQLAEDIRRSAVREDQAHRTAARATGDLRRLLRLVAEHVLDVRQGVPRPDSVELLAETLAAHGFALRQALVALQVERAEAAGRVSASEAAAAVATAPVPQG